MFDQTGFVKLRNPNKEWQAFNCHPRNGATPYGLESVDFCDEYLSWLDACAALETRKKDREEIVTAGFSNEVLIQKKIMLHRMRRETALELLRAHADQREGKFEKICQWDEIVGPQGHPCKFDPLHLMCDDDVERILMEAYEPRSGGMTAEDKEKELQRLGALIVEAEREKERFEPSDRYSTNDQGKRIADRWKGYVDHWREIARLFTKPVNVSGWECDRRELKFYKALGLDKITKRPVYVGMSHAIWKKLKAARVLPYQNTPLGEDTATAA